MPIPDHAPVTLSWRSVTQELTPHPRLPIYGCAPVAAGSEHESPSLAFLVAPQIGYDPKCSVAEAQARLNRISVLPSSQVKHIIGRSVLQSSR